MGISRAEVVQGVLDLYEAPSYLEVGVAGGVTFHELRAARKVAVDPHFRFDVAQAQAENPTNSYFQVTSDAYFGQCITDDEKFDVIYLDGLHTAEQTLCDLMSAVLFVKPRGVIILDDVVPSSYPAALPDLHAFRTLRRELNIKRGAWMGDVYRLVFFVETFMQQYSFATVSDNHGQLIMWREKRSADRLPKRTIEWVGRAAYEQVILQKANFNFAPYAEILARLTSTVVVDNAGAGPI